MLSLPSSRLTRRRIFPKFIATAVITFLLCAGHSHGQGVPVATASVLASSPATEVSARAGLRPTLDEGSGYVGPSDPSNPSAPLICNPAVRKAINLAWEESVLAAHRPPADINDKVEVGFAVDVRESDRSLRIDAMQSSDRTDRKLNELEIPVSQATVATVHTHNIGAWPIPSATDARSELPAFVISTSHLFVTVPGTSHFTEIKLKRICKKN